MTARQADGALLVLSASFHTGGPGGDYEPPRPTGIPGPEVLPATRFARPGVLQTKDASLDHDIWFHRPPRLDDWLLYDLEAVTHREDRVLTSGRIIDGEGRRVAPVTQEILARARRG